MNDDFLTRGLAALADEMPTPDVGDIVGVARERNRRRRAIGTTVLGTLAAIGVLAGAVLATRDHPMELPADQHLTPTVDAHLQSLDQQWAQAEHQLLPPGVTAELDPPGSGFAVYDTNYAPGTLADNRSGTPTPFTQSTFAGRSYRFTMLVKAGNNWGNLTITVLHSTYAAPDAIPVTPVIDAAPSELDDGTRAVVFSSGTGAQLDALRTDGTFIDVSYSVPPGSGGATGSSPLSGLTNAATMDRFALAFTY